MESSLIDLLESIGVDQDIFVAACAVASRQAHKGIVGQILAVDNFLVFKKMMVARN